MTIEKAINITDSLKPNPYSYADKVRWLSDLDGSVWEHIMGVDGGESFAGYDQNTPSDRELLVPPPFDGIYLRWLESRVDYSNGEMDRYNNSILLYNADYSAFNRWYNRKFLPSGRNYSYF